MTQETRLIFEPEDIRRVRVLCSDCGGEVTVPVKKDAAKPDHGLPEDHCPYCRKSWFRDRRLAEFQFIASLQALANMDDSRPVRLRFETDPPGSE